MTCTFGHRRTDPPRLYREKNVPLEPGDLQRLLDEGVTTLYTRSCEAEQYCDHVRSHVLADEAIPAKERYCILRTPRAPCSWLRWRKGTSTAC